MSIKEIAKIMLKSLNERLKENNISIKFTDKAITKIANAGFDATYGARPLRRAIQTEIEDMLSEKIIDGEIINGDSITIDVSRDKFVVKK